MNYEEFQTRVYHNDLKKTTAFDMALERLQEKLSSEVRFEIISISKTEGTYHLDTYYDYIIWYKI